MKFLLALTVLATTTVFAQHTKPQINCYEAAQQGGRGELAYTLEIRGGGNKNLHVVFPKVLKGPLTTDEFGCLTHPGEQEIATPPERLKLCEGIGQRIGGLVPVVSTIGDGDPYDVYCDRAILDWFGTDDLPFMK